MFKQLNGCKRANLGQQPKAEAEVEAEAQSKLKLKSKSKSFVSCET